MQQPASAATPARSIGCRASRDPRVSSGRRVASSALGPSISGWLAGSRAQAGAGQVKTNANLSDPRLCKSDPIGAIKGQLAASKAPFRRLVKGAWPVQAVPFSDVVRPTANQSQRYHRLPCRPIAETAASLSEPKAEANRRAITPISISTFTARVVSLTLQRHRTITGMIGSSALLSNPRSCPSRCKHHDPSAARPGPK
jgi:hypothetical protein